MFELTVSGSFAAAHSIPSFPKGHKCRNLHGHTWEVEVTFYFRETQDGSLCFDFGLLKKMLNDILAEFDHGGKNGLTLNDILGEIPSAENLAKYIHSELNGYADNHDEYGSLIGRKRKVKVKESPTAWVVYYGE